MQSRVFNTLFYRAGESEFFHLNVWEVHGTFSFREVSR